MRGGEGCGCVTECMFFNRSFFLIKCCSEPNVRRLWKGTPLVVQSYDSAPSAGDPGSIPGQGTGSCMLQLPTQPNKQMGFFKACGRLDGGWGPGTPHAAPLPCPSFTPHCGSPGDTFPYVALGHPWTPPSSSPPGSGNAVG